MSFRTAYNDALRNGYKNSRRGLNQGLYRDPTPEEWQKTMNEYYKRMRNWTPITGRK